MRSDVCTLTQLQVDKGSFCLTLAPRKLCESCFTTSGHELAHVQDALNVSWDARLTLICEKNATEMLMTRPGLSPLLKRSLHALPACTRISRLKFCCSILALA